MKQVFELANSRLEDMKKPRIPIDRYRGSIIITGAEAGEENQWKRIRIGSVTFRVAKPVIRCVVISNGSKNRGEIIPCNSQHFVRT